MYCNVSEFEASIGFLCLPRNLSYSEESFLDSYSVSNNFVYNLREERKIVFDNETEKLKQISKMEIDENAMRIQTDDDAGKGVPKDSVFQVRDEDLDEGYRKQFENLDIASEEGVFLNMSDDLDSCESPNGKSHTVEDFNFVISSPEENDLGKSDEGYGASIGEAVLKAMEKMHLSNEENVRKKSPPPMKTPELKINIDACGEIDNEESSNLSNEHDSSSENLSSKSDSKKSFLDSPLYEDNEFNFSRNELRKSSSLKVSKTPPGTPHRKKMVRFADAMGLDLESVRHVLNTDAPPKIPASAIADLQTGIEKDRKDMGSRYLAACFQQPGASDDFLQTVIAQKLCLENAVVTDLTITGIVRVANIGFHKNVRIRYTTNDWNSFHDIMASYVQKSCDGPTDRFSFSLVAPAGFDVGSKLVFAISYTVGDMVYWDNNSGNNYVFECYAKTTPTEIHDSWMHFL